MNGNGNGLTLALASIALVFALLASITLFELWRTTANSFRAERKDRISQVDTFLLAQCQRDAFRDRVVIKALEDARRRAMQSLPPGQTRDREIGAINSSINFLASLEGKCIADLPETAKPDQEREKK